MQKLTSDTIVESHSFGHHLHVGAHLFQTVAISLMKEILTARKALEAYLIISAVGISNTPVPAHLLVQRIVYPDCRDDEYASNPFLATKISFIDDRNCLRTGG